MYIIVIISEYVIFILNQMLRSQQPVLVCQTEFRLFFFFFFAFSFACLCSECQTHQGTCLLSALRNQEVLEQKLLTKKNI